jgi:hypothetical protein
MRQLKLLQEQDRARDLWEQIEEQRKELDRATKAAQRFYDSNIVAPLEKFAKEAAGLTKLAAAEEFKKTIQTSMDANSSELNRLIGIARHVQKKLSKLLDEHEDALEHEEGALPDFLADANAKYYVAENRPAFIVGKMGDRTPMPRTNKTPEISTGDVLLGRLFPR